MARMKHKYTLSVSCSLQSYQSDAFKTKLKIFAFLCDKSQGKEPTNKRKCHAKMAIGIGNDFRAS